MSVEYDADRQRQGGGGPRRVTATTRASRRVTPMWFLMLFMPRRVQLRWYWKQVKGHR